MFIYDKLRQQVLNKCVIANAPALQDSEGACMAPWVSPSSIPTRVVPPQMPVVVNLLAISSEETTAPVQTMEKIPIATSENKINTKMDNTMKAFQCWTIQSSKANDPRYAGYQSARPYAIQADYPPLLTPMTFPPTYPPMGPAYNRLGPNYLHYPHQGLAHCIDCDERGHICPFCPNVHIDQEQGVVHLHEHWRLPWGPRRQNGGEISGCWHERRFLSMREYSLEVARQGQQGGRDATTAAPQSPHLQHIERSQQFRRASTQGAAFRSGIPRQLL